MCPKIAENYYPNSIFEEPFIVSTIFSQSKETKCMLIPSFKEFNSDQNLKFHLFKFHNIFDGLIGLDIIKHLQVQLDFINSKFKMPHKELEIKYHLSDINSTYHANIKSHTGQRLEIPVTVDNGYVIVPQQKIQHLELKETLSLARNGYAWVEILNNNENDGTLNLNTPLIVKTDKSQRIRNFSY